LAVSFAAGDDRSMVTSPSGARPGAPTERRRTRSLYAIEALQLLFASARRRLRARALTLGTVSGFLVAGDGADLERVAELGADTDAGAPPERRDDVATWRLLVGETEMLITSLGGAMDPDLGDGVRRILAPSLVPV
jgi:hypothetical protein